MNCDGFPFGLISLLYQKMDWKDSGMFQNMLKSNLVFGNTLKSQLFDLKTKF